VTIFRQIRKKTTPAARVPNPPAIDFNSAVTNRNVHPVSATRLGNVQQPKPPLQPRRPRRLGRGDRWSWLDLTEARSAATRMEDVHFNRRRAGLSLNRRRATITSWPRLIHPSKSREHGRRWCAMAISLPANACALPSVLNLAVPCSFSEAAEERFVG
jgi:hypothetical protein